MSILTPLSRVSRWFPPSRTVSRAGRIATTILANGPFTSIGKVQMCDGSYLLLDARSRTEGGPFWTGQRGINEIKLLKICASMGPVGFDIGANVGLISIPLARYVESLGNGGKLIAFEPIGANYDRLVQNIQLNNLEATVSAHNVALGDKNEDVEMALETRYGASTSNTCVGAHVRNPSKYTTWPARMARLDAFAATHDIDRVDYIKIDVEGAEIMFLRGGVNFLGRHRPIIYGEFCNNMKPRLETPSWTPLTLSDPGTIASSSSNISSRRKFSNRKLGQRMYCSFPQKMRRSFYVV